MKKCEQVLNILVVDDDDGDAKAVMRAFKKHKTQHNILRAVDGLDALKILKGKDEKDKIESPFIMLVDLNMPRMNGVELVAKIREDEDLKDTIVFMLTTSKSEEDIQQAYKYNIAGYIVKQTVGSDFLTLINMIDSYWQVVEVPA